MTFAVCVNGLFGVKLRKLEGLVSFGTCWFDGAHHLGSTPVLGILSVGDKDETGGGMTMISRRGFDCVGLA